MNKIASRLDKIETNQNRGLEDIKTEFNLKFVSFDFYKELSHKTRVEMEQSLTRLGKQIVDFNQKQASFQSRAKE